MDIMHNKMVKFTTQLRLADAMQNDATRTRNL